MCFLNIPLTLRNEHIQTIPPVNTHTKTIQDHFLFSKEKGVSAQQVVKRLKATCEMEWPQPMFTRLQPHP